MIKNILAAVGITAIALVGISQIPQAKAGIWTMLSGAFADTIPSDFFAIEAQGANLRGYAFHLDALNRTCLFVAGEQKGGLTCWPDAENPAQ